MSYRELRDAVEILRELHYPRLISLENFRLPNFPLMAEILEWTVRKFDPNHRMPKSIETEADRVLFIKACVLALVQKARIKLNPKNLYQSDGYAVREFLPILRLLYESSKNTAQDTSNEQAQLQILRTKLAAKRQDIRQCIQKSMEIPKSSSTLYDLLAKEVFAREARIKALSQSLNVRDVEQILRKMISDARDQEQDFKTKLNNLNNDEQSLDNKIERRQREYDQLQKRLAKLQSFRPPYMDEYENYESQLKDLYREYVVQFRNLAYLQEQLDNVEKMELARSHEAEQTMRLAVEKMRNENVQIPPLSGVKLDEIKEKVIKVYGNMTGAGVSDEEDESENDLSDGQLNINELVDMDSNDEDDEELLLPEGNSALTKRREQQHHSNSRSPLHEKSNDNAQNSDDDF